jgi:hypothetical protein
MAGIIIHCKRNWKWLLVGLIGVGLLGVIWQFRPPPPPPVLPASYRAEKAAWLGVTWSMDAHSDSEIATLANDLQTHEITTIFVYVSYLKSDDTFNSTFSYAAHFVDQLRHIAPKIKILGWVGVPIQITKPGGTTLHNRLADPDIRKQIAEFSGRVVHDWGFDGVHLNAELIEDGNLAFIQTVQQIRDILPPDALLSLAVHALQPTEPVTAIPYPPISHYWSADYLRLVAEQCDQLALMAYDSGLIFPADYRSWMAFQVRQSAAILAETEVQFFIGVPVSEEWTPSHQLHTEYLENALYGVRIGLLQSDTPEAIDGIAIYPYWEIGAEEWRWLDEFP